MKTFYMRSKRTNFCYKVLAPNKKAANTILATYLGCSEIVDAVSRYFVTSLKTSKYNVELT